MGLPKWLSDKESAHQAGDNGLYPWVRQIPQRRKWQPTPILLPGKSHGQRSLAGYNFIVLQSQTELSSRARAHTHINTQMNR